MSGIEYEVLGRRVGGGWMSTRGDKRKQAIGAWLSAAEEEDLGELAEHVDHKSYANQMTKPAVDDGSDMPR